MFEEIQVTTSLFKIILPTIFTFIIGIYVGIQIKCSKHNWQRTIHIKDGIGCSKCYGIKKL